MDRESRPDHWFLGFVLWFAGSAVFLVFILQMGAVGVLYALYDAFVIDIFFTLVIHFPFLRETMGGVPRFLLGFALWFVIIAIGLKAVFQLDRMVIVASLASAAVIDAIFAVGIRLVSGVDKVRDRRAARRQYYSTDNYCSSDNYNEDGADDDDAGKILRRWAVGKMMEIWKNALGPGSSGSQYGSYYQGSDSGQADRQRMMEDAQTYRDQAYMDAAAAHSAGNDEAARSNYNEYLNH